MPLRAETMTERRLEIFEFIVAHYDQFGPPSVTTIARAMGIGKTRATQVSRRLIEDGFLTRPPGTTMSLAPTVKGRQYFEKTAREIGIIGREVHHVS